MADTDQAEGGQDQESREEELDDRDEALLHFSRYTDARRALPWEQWTFREKVGFYMDRLFLGFIVIFMLVMVGDVGYKIWYVTNMKKVAESVFNMVVSLFTWLFTQDRREELAEL